MFGAFNYTTFTFSYLGWMTSAQKWKTATKMVQGRHVYGTELCQAKIVTSTTTNNGIAKKTASEKKNITFPQFIININKIQH